MLADLGVLSRQGRLDWLSAALIIAADAAPGLEPEHERERFAVLAHPLRERGLSTMPPCEQAFVLAEHLHQGLGFRGNASDYEDPRNSLINEVLDRRLGIPITLALVYVEVGRQLGVEVVGVGFPGHFLVKICDAQRIAGTDRSVFVDPFDGALLEREDLALLAERTTGSSEVLEEWLRPARLDKTVLRMLNNLRTAYRRSGNYRRLLLVLHRMCELQPRAGALLRDRGLLQAKLGAPRAAVADLESYLHAMPHASDVQDIQELIDDLSDRVHRQHPGFALN